MGPEALLPIGGLIMAYLLTRKPKPKRKAAPKTCPPFTIDEAEVIEAAREAIELGYSGVGRVSAYVGQILYPKDRNNQTIQWPVQAPWELPINAPDAVVCLYGEIKRIVYDMPMPTEPPVEPGDRKSVV